MTLQSAFSPRVGAVSLLPMAFAFACSSSSAPSSSGTGGSSTITGGLGGGSSSGAGVSTGGSSAGQANTGGSSAGSNTGGTLNGGGAGGNALNAGAGSAGSPLGGVGGQGGTDGATSGVGAGAKAGGGAQSTSGAGGTLAGAAGRGGAGGKSGGGAGAGAGSGSSDGGNGGASGFVLTSPAWTSQAGCAPDNKPACGIFPKDNTNLNGGKNQSPELDWTPGPSGTLSYAIVLHDLTNVTNGKPFVHWVMWNIPASTSMLPANLEKTAMPSVPIGSSQRSYSGTGFQGSGKCGNVYEFVLYALKTATFTPSGAATQTAAADALDAAGAPTTTLRGRSGAPECSE
jgi:phosphatidylethanolamine-binding protein (PEBP) family uncharacterized protein